LPTDLGRGFATKGETRKTPKGGETCVLAEEETISGGGEGGVTKRPGGEIEGLERKQGEEFAVPNRLKILQGRGGKGPTKKKSLKKKRKNTGTGPEVSSAYEKREDSISRREARVQKKRRKTRLFSVLKPTARRNKERLKKEGFKKFNKD